MFENGMEFLIFRDWKFRFSSLAPQEFGITTASLEYHQGSLAMPPKENYKLRKTIICNAPSREFDYLIMKFDLISVIFRLHGSTVFRNFHLICLTECRKRPTQSFSNILMTSFKKSSKYC